MDSYYPLSILTVSELRLLHHCILGIADDVIRGFFLKKLESCDYSFSKAEINYLSDCLTSYRTFIHHRDDMLNIWTPDVMLCDKLIGKLELCLSFSDELKYDEYIDYID